MSEQTPALELWNEMVTLWEKLKSAKPTERNETARRYAVAITEYEKVLGYFNTFIVEGLVAEMPGDGG